MTDEKIIIVEPATETVEKTVYKPRGPSPLLWLLTLASLLVAVASLLPWFVPSLGQRLPLVRQQIEAQAAMRDHVTDLESKIALPAPVPAASAASAAAAAPQADVDVSMVLADAQKKIDSLQGQLLTVNTAVTAQGQRLDQQQEMAGTIKTQSVTAALSAMQPLLILQNIRAKIDSGSTYQADLEQLKDVPTEAERAALQKLAQGGPARDEIAAALKGQTRPLAAAYREAMAVTWWEKIKARLSGLISIKTTGTTDDPVMVGLDQLVVQVRRGDDSAALATIDSLPASVKTMLGGTQVQLQDRRAAQDALSAITQRLLAVAP